MPEFWNFFGGFLTSTAVISFILYLARDIFLKIFGNNLEIKLEEVRGDLRKGEGEITSIRDYIFSSQRERDNILQSKKIEAAEILLNKRNVVHKLSSAVHYMKVLDADKLANHLEEPNVKRFVDYIFGSLKMDEVVREIESLNGFIPDLYLGKRTLDLYNAYYLIIIRAATTMSLLSRGGYSSDIFEKNFLRDIVVDLCPSSKEGFDRYGENYAYHWTDYFYKEILVSLRSEVLDISSNPRVSDDLVSEIRRVSDEVSKSGLPNDVIRKEGELKVGR